MISAIVSRLVILVFGTLYPAYASYKAVRTKNVKEYVKWMMYWIVFALFTCAETFTDVFLSFWFPFYYEIKIILVLWLLSPATKGSSILYRKFVHPMLSRREQDIDEYIAKAKEQGYHTVLHLGTKGVNYATNVIMQTAIKGGGGLVNQIRRSYSLSDLSGDDCGMPQMAAGQDQLDAPQLERRKIRPRSGYSPRRSASGSGRVDMYFPEVDVDVRQTTQAQREVSISFSHIRSSEDVSSGYSSAEPLYSSKGVSGVGSVIGGLNTGLVRTGSVGGTSSRAGRKLTRSGSSAASGAGGPGASTRSAVAAAAAASLQGGIQPSGGAPPEELIHYIVEEDEDLILRNEPEILKDQREREDEDREEDEVFEEPYLDTLLINNKLEECLYPKEIFYTAEEQFLAKKKLQFLNEESKYLISENPILVPQSLTLANESLSSETNQNSQEPFLNKPEDHIPEQTHSIHKEIIHDHSEVTINDIPKNEIQPPGSLDIELKNKPEEREKPEVSNTNLSIIKHEEESMAEKIENQIFSNEITKITSNPVETEKIENQIFSNEITKITSSPVETGSLLQDILTKLPLSFIMGQTKTLQLNEPVPQAKEIIQAIKDLDLKDINDTLLQKNIVESSKPEEVSLNIEDAKNSNVSRAPELNKEIIDEREVVEKDCVENVIQNKKIEIKEELDVKNSEKQRDDETLKSNDIVEKEEAHNNIKSLPRKDDSSGKEKDDQTLKDSGIIEREVASLNEKLLLQKDVNSDEKKSDDLSSLKDSDIIQRETVSNNTTSFLREDINYLEKQRDDQTLKDNDVIIKEAESNNAKSFEEKIEEIKSEEKNVEEIVTDSIIATASVMKINERAGKYHKLPAPARPETKEVIPSEEIKESHEKKEKKEVTFKELMDEIKTDFKMEDEEEFQETDSETEKEETHPSSSPSSSRTGSVSPRIFRRVSEDEAGTATAVTARLVLQPGRVRQRADKSPLFVRESAKRKLKKRSQKSPMRVTRFLHKQTWSTILPFWGNSAASATDPETSSVSSLEEQQIQQRERAHNRPSRTRLRLRELSKSPTRRSGRKTNEVD